MGRADVVTPGVDPVTLSEAEARKLPEFLDLIRQGTGNIEAALAVGWSPKRLRQLMADHDFLEVIQIAHERRIENIEKRLYEMADNKHFPAIQMILYSQAADRGWRPPQQRVAVKHTGVVALERVNAVREAALAIMAEQGVVALAAGGDLGDDDDDIVDAEILG